MLATVQTHWLDVCEYFSRVQCARTEDEERVLARELPKVEESLGIMLDALLTERHQIEIDQQASWQHHEGAASGCQEKWPSMGSLASSVLQSSHGATPNQANCRSIADVSPSSGMWSFAETTSTAALSAGRTAAAGCRPPDDVPSAVHSPIELLPCYHYLFALPPSPSSTTTTTTTSVSTAPLEPDAALTQPPPGKPVAAAVTSVSPAGPTGGRKVAAPAEANMTSVFPDSIGATFFLTLCLYVKHNHPAGSRTIVLRFLQDLIQRADLPTARRHPTYPRPGRYTSAMAGMCRSDSTASPRSILQLSLSSSIVPLLDMIRRVGVELDPRHASKACRSPPSHSDLQTELTSGDAERTAFVRFLCALSERIEQVPDLANYFVTTAPGANGEDGEGPSGGSKEEHFVLLEILLPYMTHDCTASGWEQRRDTCRFALSAVLSLAKCPDPWVQDLVAKETMIADRTLAAASTTLLTLCKIPDNDDSEVQLLYLRDVLRFWSALCLSAPVVADGLRIAELVEDSFAKTTLASLLMSPDSRVYSAACLVTSVLLADLNSSGPVVPTAVARALLSGVVDMGTGQCRPHPVAALDYYDHMQQRRRRRGGGGGGGGGGNDDDAHSDRPLHSFFDCYVLRHLNGEPTLTEEDMSSRSVLSVVVTEWTAVEATLTLLKSLAENCPYLFAKYALLADMRELLAAQPASDAAAALPPTSASFPTIDLKECFSDHLRTAEGASREEICGVSRRQLGEDVFEAMLRMETNAPSDALYALQCAVLSLPDTRGTAGSAQASKQSGRNAWYSSPTAQEAPLTKALCNLLSDFVTIPFRSAVLLTQLCVRVCLLPDPRVLYTFLDPARGPMTQALQQVRRCVDRGMEESEKVAIASAATESMRETRSGAKRKEKSVVRPAAAEEAPTTLTVTCAALYELYLLYWEYLPAHVLSSLEDERDTRAVEKISLLPAPSLLAGGPGVVSDDLIKALIRRQPFLESCANLEQLMMELSAAVQCMTLSHRLLSLSV